MKQFNGVLLHDGVDIEAECSVSIQLKFYPGEQYHLFGATWFRNDFYGDELP